MVQRRENFRNVPPTTVVVRNQPPPMPSAGKGVTDHVPNDIQHLTMSLHTCLVF